MANVNPFKPNLASFNSYYEKAQYTLAWRMAALFSIIFLPLSILYTTSSLTAGLVTGAAALVAIGCWIYLYITKNPKMVFWIVEILGFFIIHYSMNFAMETTHHVDFLWIVAMIFIAFIGLNRTVGWIVIVVNVIGVAYFYLVTLNELIVVLEPKPMLFLVSELIELVIALFVVGYLSYLYATIIAQSKTGLEKINEELVHKNTENVYLLKEVHHRVKNNLQIITSLLRIQKSDLDEHLHEPFNEAINRIMSMSLIHQKLYSKDKLSDVRLADYLQDLGDEIQRTQSIDADIEIEVDAKDVELDMETVVPIGLIVNELVTNSLKHAFTTKQHGKINIGVCQNPNGFQLVYSDDGNWVKPMDAMKGFGTEMIEVLVDQLDGSVNRSGSSYEFNFHAKQ